MWFCSNLEINMGKMRNTRIFKRLINFGSNIHLKNHVDTNTVFESLSKTIQNEILDCFLQIKT